MEYLNIELTMIFLGVDFSMEGNMQINDVLCAVFRKVYISGIHRINHLHTYMHNSIDRNFLCYYKISKFKFSILLFLTFVY